MRDPIIKVKLQQNKGQNDRKSMTLRGFTSNDYHNDKYTQVGQAKQGKAVMYSFLVMLCYLLQQLLQLVVMRLLVTQSPSN